MEKKNLVILITGGTSGIGLAAYNELRKDENTVYTFSRRKADIEGSMAIDVTDEEAVKEAVEEIIRREGGIDVLINAAGFGISGAIEFTELEDAKRQMDVNFFGMVNVCKATLPYMRKRGTGRIINISSVAGMVSIPFQTYYSSTKAAIESYTLGLENEVRPYGISVCAIEPGDIRTGFTSARKKSFIGDEEYSGRIERSVKRMEKDEMNGMDPMVVGRFIRNVSYRKRIKPIYTVGLSYKLLCLLVKILPRRVSNYIVYQIYAK